MARPHKPIQRRSNGNFFVRLIDGKRLTKYLETKDARVAAKRAAQALEGLELEAAAPQQLRWRADEVGIEWDIPSNADGSNDYENANPRQIQASHIANPEELRGIRWRDLLAGVYLSSTPSRTACCVVDSFISAAAAMRICG